MYLEKYNNHGLIINLDHVASMNWDKPLTAEFVMTNGETITWTYGHEDERAADLDKISKRLYDGGMLISVELDQE